MDGDDMPLDDNPLVPPDGGPGSLTREDRCRLSGPALRTFIRIAEFRKVTHEESLAILGNPARSSYDRWRRRARRNDDLCLAEETLRRISLVLQIHAALMTLFTDPYEAESWLSRPHDAAEFGGRRPHDLLISGAQDELMGLHGFLSAACMGLYMPPHTDEAETHPCDDSEIIFK